MEGDYLFLTSALSRFGGFPVVRAATQFSAAIIAILKRVRSEELAIWGDKTTFFSSRNPG